MCKRFLRTFLIAVLIAAMLVVPAFAESAVTTGTDVCLRTGPGSDYAIIDCLPKGASVTVLDRSNPDWYKISYNGVTVFMSSAYLSLTDDSTGAVTVDSATITTESKPGSINGMFVRFRSAPSHDSGVIATYNTGKSLTITGYNGEWTAVTIDGRSGFVYSAYVVEGSVSPATVEVGGFSEVPSVTPVPEQPAVTPEPTPEPTPAPTQAPVTAPSGSTVGYICGDYVRFRTGPSTYDTIINNYDRGKQLAITGVSGDWTAAIIDGVSGYVFTQYVSLTDPTSASVELSPAEPAPAVTDAPVVTPAPVQSTAEKPGYFKGNTVRFRSGPSLNASILGEYYYGNPMIITGISGDWTQAIVNGVTGYVYSPYVAEGTFSVSGAGTSGSAAKGTEIANFALRFVGCSYVWGGASPEEGFDCSGLVYYAYAHFGYTLERVADDQAHSGTPVSPDNMQPGDIICFYSGGGYVGHVGIYIGDGKFVHAANSATGVVVSELTGYYATRGYDVRRIVG